MGARAASIEALPLFATDAEIGRALLGAARAKEWQDKATVLEREGLPRVDPMMGGRYVPAVKAFFDRRYKVASPSGPSTPDGIEQWR